ncbi:MAG: FHA domain-containing protein [Methylococcales bacterium]
MADIEIHLSPLTFPEPPAIVVSDEFFLIGRESQMFRAWKDARLKRLSREHARFEIKGPAASLCDLGSTNGTKINNDPLTAYQPYPIKDGDIISFANVFKYEVKIVQCKPTEDTVITQVTSEHVRDERIVKNKTMFIASADSYLNMLCEEDDRNDRNNSQQTSSKNSRLWIIIAAVAVILAVAGGTLFYLSTF